VVPRESTWQPARVEADVDLADFHYAVVEEGMADDDVVVLLIAPWPEAGAEERPYFPYGIDEFVLAAEREPLRQRLSERRLDAGAERLGEGAPGALEELRNRNLSVGDVFALRLDPGFDPGAAPDGPLREFDWIADAIDVTAEAREAAKWKMVEALTPELKDEVVEDLLGEVAEGEGA